MNSLNPVQWERWRALLKQGRDQAAVEGRHILVSLALACEPFDALSQVAVAEVHGLPYALLESREPDRVLLGIGQGIELLGDQQAPLASLGALWRQWQASAVQEGPCGALVMGGARFDVASQCLPHWADFPAAMMTLYPLQWLQQPEGCWLLLQARVGAAEGVDVVIDEQQRLLHTLGRSLAVPLSVAEPVGGDLPSIPTAQWQDAVGKALHRIHHGDMHKVVLARHVLRRHSAPVAVAALLQRLRQRNASAHLFAVRRGESCFLGATPERLGHLQSGVVSTHALAGTCARGIDSTSDQRLGQALMSSAKEREEHDVVVRTICQGLESLGGSVYAAQVPELRKLPTLQHLSTPIRAEFGEQVGVLDVIEQLHPTPAVAGLALDHAMAFIRQHEGLDRGWYAGPIGWMNDREDGDFVVALRSVLVRGADAYLFAGCGVVAESTPEQEYQETCLKLSGMLNALQTEPAATLA